MEYFLNTPKITVKNDLVIGYYLEEMYLLELCLTVYVWTAMAISMIVTMPICLVLYPFLSQKKISRIYEKIPAVIVFTVMRPFWKLQIYDLRKEKSWTEQYIITANHLSFLDSLVLAHVIPLEKKFMVGRGFQKIPIFGRLSELSGHVPADLNDPEVNKSAVPRAVQTIQKDSSSFAIYPEGRRELSPYRFEPFKTGAYRIAKITGLEILPVTLAGTYEAMRFGGIVSPATITVWIDEPFSVCSEDYSKYIQKNQEIITKNLSKI